MGRQASTVLILCEQTTPFHLAKIFFFVFVNNADKWKSELFFPSDWLFKYTIKKCGEHLPLPYIPLLLLDFGGD